MFISPAYAQGAEASGMGGMETLLMFVPIFLVFYFLVIRPNQKRQKQHRELIGALRRGDRIVTAGGLIGQVSRVISDTELQVEISEGVRVRVARAMVSDVLAKPDPASASANDDADSDGDGETKPARTRRRRGGGGRTTQSDSENAKAGE